MLFILFLLHTIPPKIVKNDMLSPLPRGALGYIFVVLNRS